MPHNHHTTPEARTLRMAARYLGLKGEAANQPQMAALLADAYARLQGVCKPKHRLVRMALAVEAEGAVPWVKLGTMEAVQSHSLRQLLAGCAEGYALLATLGMEVDLLIRRLLVTDAALGTAVGACGSAYIDVYIDDILKKESAALRGKGEALTPRFSPGYGDAPLSMQPGLLYLCGARHMGVTLTQENMMLPEKTVSAVMGILPIVSSGGATYSQRACAQGCEACGHKHCEYREEDI